MIIMVLLRFYLNITHVILLTMPCRFSACNIEKLEIGLGNEIRALVKLERLTWSYRFATVDCSHDNIMKSLSILQRASVLYISWLPDCLYMIGELHLDVHDLGLRTNYTFYLSLQKKVYFDYSNAAMNMTQDKECMSVTPSRRWIKRCDSPINIGVVNLVVIFKHL